MALLEFIFYGLGAVTLCNFSNLEQVTTEAETSSGFRSY